MLMFSDLIKYLFLLSIKCSASYFFTATYILFPFLSQSIIHSPNAFIVLSVYVLFNKKSRVNQRQYESIRLVSCNTLSLKPLNRTEISLFLSAVTSRISASLQGYSEGGRVQSLDCRPHNGRWMVRNDACVDGASVVADEKGVTSQCPGVCCRQSINNQRPWWIYEGALSVEKHGSCSILCDMGEDKGESSSLGLTSAFITSPVASLTSWGITDWSVSTRATSLFIAFSQRERYNQLPNPDVSFLPKLLIFLKAHAIEIERLVDGADEVTCLIRSLYTWWTTDFCYEDCYTIPQYGTFDKFILSVNKIVRNNKIVTGGNIHTIKTVHTKTTEGVEWIKYILFSFQIWSRPDNRDKLNWWLSCS